MSRAELGRLVLERTMPVKIELVAPSRCSHSWHHRTICYKNVTFFNNKQLAGWRNGSAQPSYRTSEYGQAEAVGSSPTSVAPFWTFLARFWAFFCGLRREQRCMVGVQRVFLHVIVDRRGSSGGLASGAWGEDAGCW